MNKAIWPMGMKFTPSSLQFWNPNGGFIAGALLGLVVEGVALYITPLIFPIAIGYIAFVWFFNNYEFVF